LIPGSNFWVAEFPSKQLKILSPSQIFFSSLWEHFWKNETKFHEKTIRNHGKNQLKISLSNIDGFPEN
jgi:hypothetical protein